MKRRHFIQLSAASALPALLGRCNFPVLNQYDIQVRNDITKGHTMFEPTNWTKQATQKVGYLIVGGGLAGLSAAWQLKDKNYRVIELSDRLGGTSGGQIHKSQTLAQGAHYDLAYPEYYGEDTLKMLESLGIIKYNSWQKLWGFVDRKYTIPKFRESKAYFKGNLQDEVLPDGEQKHDFFEILSRFDGKMTMPTRLIEEDLKVLNNESFLSFLQMEMTLTPDFIRGLDYHMIDDYGGTAAQVSALAGVHYFMCRPYYKQVVELFSPSQGNNYFVKKIASELDASKVKSGQMVTNLNPTSGGVTATVLDFQNQSQYQIEANKVIYAGQKHALKYVYALDENLFADNEYAPWMVINIVLKEPLESDRFWQNEIVVDDKTFLGFINSSAQNLSKGESQVLTAYYCFDSADRATLKNVETNKDEIVNDTISKINNYFKLKINSKIDKVYINVMGHAMPIPKPGYLFNDKNETRSNENIVYAGVDNSRLPLLFEALDSGIYASQLATD